MPTLQEYKCPCCGGAVNFDSQVQKMKCPYCDTEFEMEALKAQEESAAANQPDSMDWEQTEKAQWDDAEEMQVYVCQSCGGEIVTDENTAATICPYCDNPVTLTGRLSGVLKPELVVPFQLTKKDAVDALSRHVQKKFLLPKVFKDQNHIDEVKGIYVPFWLFDADTDADAQFRATRIRHWSTGNYDYTETGFYQAVRSGTMSFRNIPVDGSQKMEDALMESIEPFHMDGAMDFQSAYLAGYLADKYDVDAETAIERANTRIKHSAEEVLSGTVTGYSTVETVSSSVRFSGGKSRYALLPVWLLNTTYNGQNYRFAMNGQTGKIVGDLPMDKKKYWGFWALLAGTLSAAFIALSYLVFL